MKQSVLTSVCLLSHVKLHYMGVLSDITFYKVVLYEFIAHYSGRIGEMFYEFPWYGLRDINVRANGFMFMFDLVAC